MRICAEEMPGYTTFSSEHKAACWLHYPMASDVEPPVIGGSPIRISENSYSTHLGE